MQKKFIILGIISIFLGYLLGNGIISKKDAQDIKQYAEDSFGTDKNESAPAQSTQPPLDVERVIDGDTIRTGSGLIIRYIGIDTPEISGKRPECYGKEAAEYNRLLVEGKTIELYRDKELQDKYGRELRFVYVNGENINIKLVRDGYAKRIYVAPNALFQKELAEAQKEAQTQKRGLWNACP